MVGSNRLPEGKSGILRVEIGGMFLAEHLWKKLLRFFSFSYRLSAGATTCRRCRHLGSMSTKDSVLLRWSSSANGFKTERFETSVQFLVLSSQFPVLTPDQPFVKLWQMKAQPKVVIYEKPT